MTIGHSSITNHESSLLDRISHHVGQAEGDRNLVEVNTSVPDEGGGSVVTYIVLLKMAMVEQSNVYL